MRKLVYILVCMTLWKCSDSTLKEDSILKEDHRTAYPYYVIANVNTTYDSLDKALLDLDTIVREPLAFWINIIQDTNFNTSQNGTFIMYLFKRHVTNGMNLKHLRDLCKEINLNHRELKIRWGNDPEGVWDNGELKQLNYLPKDYCTLKKEISDKHGSMFFLTWNTKFDFHPNTIPTYHCNTYGVYLGVNKNINPGNLKSFLFEARQESLIDPISVVGKCAMYYCDEL